MSGKKNLAQAKSVRARAIKVAPVTHAVRLALAATTLALAGTGAAYAGTCSTTGNTTQCTGGFADTISIPDAVDLTLVVGDGATPTSVFPANGATGIEVEGDGAIDIGIDAYVDVSTIGADGVFAYSSGSLAITNDGSIQAYVTGAGQEGIDAFSLGDLTVTNNGDIAAFGEYDATAVRAQSDGCDCTVTVENAGDAGIYASSVYGSAIGVYAYDAAGTVHVGNDGVIYATSFYGLADGVFAAGDDVGVRNGGDISVAGYGWAAGIEAEGSDVVSVRNGGTIYASAYANTYGIYGHAYGIYAAGGAGGATVDNLGLLRVTGVYATGINASALGDVNVTNGGDIEVGGYGSAYATGIHAASNGEGGDVSLSNTGYVGAGSYFTSTGIEVVATGTGASASVDNSGVVYAGTVYAIPASKYGSATGIVVSADGDAHVGNSGTVVVTQAAYGGYGVQPLSHEGFQPYYGGTAYGVMALSFNGDASIDNSGDVHVTADPFGYAGGVVAASQNGNASIDNSGFVESHGKYAYGLIATSSAGDVTVTNEATGQAYAYSMASLPYAFAAALGGIATQGDATIGNAGDAFAISYGTAIGMFGLAGQGNVSEDNSGYITAVSYTAAIGSFARADYGVASATNSGFINAYAVGQDGDAVGMFARSDYGTAAVDNAGGVIAVSYYGTASGIRAGGATVDVGNTGGIGVYAYQSGYGIEVVAGDQATIDNGGSVYVSSLEGNAFGVFGLSSNGDVAIGGDGDITARGGSAVFGAYAYAPYGTASVHNDGGIDVASEYGLADGILAAGANVDVASTGDITATGVYWAAGVEAHGDTVGVANGGTIQANALGGYGYGLFASGATSVDATNSGSISVNGRQATGIFASGGGTATVDNSGDITVGDMYTSLAAGIGISTSGDAVATNGGDINATGSTLAFGVAISTYGSASVANSGTVYASTSAKYGAAVGLSAGGYAEAHIDNSGSLAVSGGQNGYGAVATATEGLAGVTNAGDIEVTAPFGRGAGIRAGSYAGDASIDDTGSISIAAKYAYGALATSHDGDASVHVGADGTVAVYSGVLGVGLSAQSYYGNASVANDGTVTVNAGGMASGIRVTSDYGDASAANSGDISATNYEGQALGVIVTAGAGDAGFHNTGAISAYGNAALGALVQGDTVHFANGGDLQGATYGGNAYGAYVTAFGASASIDNSGTIGAQAAYGESSAVGMDAYSAGTLDVHNTGTIAASADGAYGQAIGLYAAAYGALHVDNGGLITASQADYAVAVSLNSATVSVLNNTGTIATDAAVEGQVAVRGRDGIEQVLNYGQIEGAMLLNGGDDLVFNGNGGVWTVGNHATDFGDGDDTLAIGSGGLVDLTDASIAFGAGDDAVANAGTLRLHGGALYLGDSSADGNSFTNTGHIEVIGTGNLIDMGSGPAEALVPSTNPVALANNGVIDFHDGAPDDVLTINGDLGGSGAINIDLRPLTGASDLLYVDGNVVSGTVQTVNVDFGGPMGTDVLDTSTPFAHVSGTSSAGSFVGGQVLGWNASDFIDLQVNVTREAGSDADVFSVGVAAAGLSDPGTLAASIAPGVQSLVNAQVGTWRQRMGVVPDKGTIGLSPWLRMFGDAGDVRPGHVADNFGAGGNFDFQQSNTGWELGLNTRPGEHLNLGVLIAKSEGHQHLDDGAGTNYLDGRTFGVYATWTADRFYVDASMRWMGFDADLRSPGNRQRTDGSADAFNIEAGFSGWTVGGLNLQPQVQYTHTRVSDIRPVRGASAVFEADSAGSSRGRVGLAVDKAMQAGAWTLTPYGSLNAVREFDGKYGYNVDDVFFGSTRTEGTSALVELGMGARKDKLSVSGGLNWTDGGALNSVFGGQLVVRYNW